MITFDEDAIAAVLNLGDDDLAERLVDARRRARESLPIACADEICSSGPKQTFVYAIVLAESALSALGQSSRSLCDQIDPLHLDIGFFERKIGDHERLVSGEDVKCSISRRLAIGWREEQDMFSQAAEIAMARMFGLRSVLCVQLQRESWERDGLSIPPEWRLPIVGGDGGATAYLELVPLDPDPTPTGGGGGEGGAAPVAVVAQPPADSVDPGTAVDDDDGRGDDDGDGLDFSDLDRRS